MQRSCMNHASDYIRKDEELGFILEFRYGLEVDGGVGLRHALEEFEDPAKSSLSLTLPGLRVVRSGSVTSL